jgi:hypothetical protein
MPVKPETPEDDAWNEELDRGEVPFIDDVWLDSVRFSVDNYQVIGFEGAGATSVVFNARGPKGEEVVLKTAVRDWSFPSYIHELRECQDLDRLHRKLERLIGDPMLDQIVTTYSDLYRTIVDNLHDWAAPFDQLKWNNEEATQIMSFGVRAPGTISKLGQIASHSESRPETVAWAKQTLDLLERINVEPVLRPEILLENPLYVWGGAILSGYFPGDITDVSSRVRSRLTAQPQKLETFVTQSWAIAGLLMNFQIPSKSFEQFCKATCDGL